MFKRIVLSGIAGAVLVFLMSTVFHLATRLGEVGVKGIANEDAVMATLRSEIHESGFYYFPGPNMAPGRTKEQMDADNAAYMAKYKAGPNGIIILNTGGEDFNFPKHILNQFLFSLLSGLLIAWILQVTAAATSYGTRLGIVIVIAITGATIYTLPYWNWYGFPGNYIVAELVTWTVSWFVAGLAMAKISKPVAA
jgi:hypothetical protein